MSAGKLVLGLVLLVIGILLFADSWGLHVFPGSINWWGNFLTVLTGVVPILLIFMGLFVVWLEMDEMKASKEFKKS